MEHATQRTFKRNAHIAYFKRCLQALPAQATGHDSNRITIAYFCLAGLDLLDALAETKDQHSEWIAWIWSLQSPSGGFSGSPFMITNNPDTSPAHIPSTYTALLCLAILRAPLDRLNIPALGSFLSSCQGQDGSFSPIPRHAIEGDFQSDMRMTYCATVVAEILGLGACIDQEGVQGMIARSKTWEGGYAARPGVIEAQGGTTYCAIASGAEVDEQCVRWLVSRQIGGFQGRPGKLEDVCYSFWCGAALRIIGKGSLVNEVADCSFLMASQSPIGGFGKEPEEFPDPFHSYLALAALALHGQAGLKTLDPKWNVTSVTAEWLTKEVERII